MAARQTLEQWIHSALTDEDKGRPCARIALVHKQGGKEIDLHVTTIGGRQWSARDLAKMFMDKAENYAAELPGYQQFNLYAFYGDSTEWEAIKPFSVAGRVENPGDATEPPTKEGFLQQCMRHTEAMTQMALRQTANMTTAMNQMFEQVVRENISLRRENQEATTIVRDCIIKMTAQRDETAMKRLEYERATRERQQWLAYGPALINSLLGREIFPQNTADTALIEAIAESLTEDDMQLLSTRIKPHLMGPLAQRMAAYLEKKRLAQETAAKALANIDPEEDASGLIAAQ